MSDFVPGLVLGLLLGLFSAYATCDVTTATIRAGAVKAGVGEYYVPQGENKAKFRWLSPLPEAQEPPDAPAR
jgi:hypothetical protein